MQNEQPTHRFWRSSWFWPGITILISSLIGIPGLWFGYLAIRPSEANVVFETVNAIEVIDVNQPVENLSIVFQGEDINSKSLNLWILTVRVANVGNANILPSHYDTEDDWGIGFDQGELIDVKLIDASSEYLKMKFDSIEIRTNSIIFPKIIFDKGEFVQIEILMIHDKHRTPPIHSLGKIAGVEEIMILNSSPSGEYLGFWEAMFPGGFWMNYFRIWFYMVVSMALIFALVWILGASKTLVNAITRRQRRDRLAQTKSFQQIEDDRIKEFFRSLYELGGSEAFEELHWIIKRPEKVVLSEAPSRWTYVETDDLYEIEPDDPYEINSEITLETLAYIGVLRKNAHGKAHFEQQFCETVTRLVAELES